MRKKNIGYDETKKMLNVIRMLNENKKTSKTKILEQEERTGGAEQNSDIAVINDVDVKIASNDQADMVLTDEHKNSISTIIDSFRSQVSQLTEFDPGFTISQDQIRLDGSIDDLDINFVLISGNESGLYINADMLKVEEETIIVFEKLQKFEKQFQQQMDIIIRDRKNN